MGRGKPEHIVVRGLSRQHLAQEGNVMPLSRQHMANAIRYVVVEEEAHG